jgi:hypothetical protein
VKTSFKWRILVRILKFCDGVFESKLSESFAIETALVKAVAIFNWSFNIALMGRPRKCRLTGAPESGLMVTENE